MVDGVLTGARGASPLLSGYTFGDFEVRFQWTVAEQGSLHFALPEVPDGPGLRLTLCEGAGCGRLTDGSEELAAGIAVGPRPNGWHTVRLLRADGKLTVWIDDAFAVEVAVDSRRRFGLELSMLAGHGEIRSLRAAEPAGKWLLQDPDDLADWDGNKKSWRMEGDELALHPQGLGYLRSKKEYANFTLSFDYKAADRCNSGFGIRTPPGGWPSGDGMEIQIWDRPFDEPLNEHSQMAIYGNVPPLARADRRGEWNSVVVKADGWMISAWVNGELTQQFNTLHHPELKHRRLQGWIGPQDHRSAIRFRNLRLLEAPPGTGLVTWLDPRPMNAVQRVVDRLMNTESLSRDDGVVSHAVSRRISGSAPRELVLAKLTGPGAAVRLARANDSGRLAFYFDGEAAPRLECEPNELYRRAVQISNDREPVLTCLAYEKSLTIVLRDGKDVDYRIEYLTFPEETPLETFGGLESVPRGWPHSALYRQHVMRSGVHREKDAARRAGSKPKTIAPGETATLARIEGAGLVRWLKLQGEPKVLARDDLWLEVTIDGESRPAISAPARLLLPGFVDGGNYYNFVLVNRNGLANMLAMPFGAGITVAAVNHGDRPIENVGVELCYEPATDRTREDIRGRMRLRGTYLPASDDTDELFRIDRAGRWVGLVCDVADGEAFGVADLFVDGRPADGWNATSLARFLGREGNDYRVNLSGHKAGLAWRYLLLAPVDCRESLRLTADTKRLPQRLIFYYSAP